MDWSGDYSDLEFGCYFQLQFGGQDQHCSSNFGGRVVYLEQVSIIINQSNILPMLSRFQSNFGM